MSSDKRPLVRIDLETRKALDKYIATKKKVGRSLNLTTALHEIVFEANQKAPQ